MGLFTKKIGPVFLKESSDAAAFIVKMEELKQNASGEVKQKIEKQINLARYGEIGESNIAFELKNSGLDMYILHDVYFEMGELSAQIDYMVITRKHVYVVECKNLIGNIEIDNTGAFIRSYEFAGRKIKEGIYSPITQNQRHLRVLKETRKASKSNFLSKMLFEKSFDETYKSIVVLANPKTYLNAKYARKEIKDQVIRADQLISYIKEKDALVKDFVMNTDEMLNLAQFYLSKNKPERSDYAQKYEEMVGELGKTKVQKKEQINPQRMEELPQKQQSKSENQEAIKENKKNEQKIFCEEVKTDSLGREEIVKRLKKFRLEQSRKENIKPYYIFNDAQLNDLLDKLPQNKEELLKISGFGPVKIEKYGQEIVNILCELS